jgi:hypothetical protein
LRVHTAVLFLLFIFLLIAYLVPWVVNPGASLTLGGYDLAEWTSLHPAVVGETPPLLTTFLLRLPLVCVTIALAFFIMPEQNNRIVGGIVLLLMGFALLPPLEILDDPGNWNYRQQLALAVGTVLIGAIGLSGKRKQMRPFIGSFMALVGAGACLVGLSRAFNLMQGFNLPSQIGAGGVVTAMLFVAFVITQWQIGQRIALRRPIHAGQHV